MGEEFIKETIAIGGNEDLVVLAVANRVVLYSVPRLAAASAR